MKVILLQDVRNVGRKNEVKEVNDGFARNFLLSKKLALPASDSTVKILNQQKANQEKEKNKEKEKYIQLVEKMKNLFLEFKTKVGEKGKTFGSISSAEIKEALKKKGIAVEKDWIETEHIKTTGEKIVKISFPQGISGEVKVIIEAE